MHPAMLAKMVEALRKAAGPHWSETTTGDFTFYQVGPNKRCDRIVFHEGVLRRPMTQASRATQILDQAYKTVQAPKKVATDLRYVSLYTGEPHMVPLSLLTQLALLVSPEMRGKHDDSDLYELLGAGLIAKDASGNVVPTPEGADSLRLLQIAS